MQSVHFYVRVPKVIVNSEAYNSFLNSCFKERLHCRDVERTAASFNGLLNLEMSIHLKHAAILIILCCFAEYL